MSIATQIKNELNLPGFTTQAYWQDLTDADLMRRPVPSLQAAGQGSRFLVPRRKAE